MDELGRAIARQLRKRASESDKHAKRSSPRWRAPEETLVSPPCETCHLLLTNPVFACVFRAFGVEHVHKKPAAEPREEARKRDTKYTKQPDGLPKEQPHQVFPLRKLRPLNE